MVPRHAQVGHEPDGDAVASVRVADHDPALDDRLKVEDRHLWLVDERGGEHGAEGTRVRDREGPAAELHRGHAPAAGTLGEIRDARREALVRELVSVPDDRHDAALVAERDRDPEVDRFVDGERLPVERGIEGELLAQRRDRRPRDERAF